MNNKADIHIATDPVLPHQGPHVMSCQAPTSMDDVQIERVQREIEGAERHHQRFAHGMVHLPDGRMQVTEEMDLLLLAVHMEKTIKCIVSTKGSAIERVKIAGTKDQYRDQLTPVGEAIWLTYREAMPTIEQMYPGCRRTTHWKRERGMSVGVRAEFNPYITVALHACQVAMPILSLFAGQRPDLSQSKVRRAFDHLLRSVRRICHSKRFKDLAGNYPRNAQQVFKRSCTYIDRLFSKTSELLILRVDLYFLPKDKKWADTAAADRCIRRFRLALQKGRVVPNVKGWAMRRDNAFRRGIHVRVLVAMDGYLHREAAHWSRVIGEDWVDNFSECMGSYLKCNARKDWSKFNDPGLVHVADWEKRMVVCEALRSMTKSDFHVATGFKKNFWKGQVRNTKLVKKGGAPRNAKPVKKSGAPRKAKHGMALVSELLGSF